MLVKEKQTEKFAGYFAGYSVGTRFSGKVCLLQELKLSPFASKPGSYLLLKVMDKTGGLPGRVWNNAEALYKQFKAGDVVSISGVVDAYKGEKQLIVNDMVSAGNVGPEEFLVKADDYDALQVEFVQKLKILQSESSKEGAALVSTVFSPSRFERFIKIPAAVKYHHAYVGGLMKHTLTVVKNAERLRTNYGDNADRELLLLGALLHDIGKVDELNCAATFEYSAAGTLVGHIILGALIVKEAIDKVRLETPFSNEKELMLLHIIASHHGQAELGALQEPKTLEALIVHHADWLDADAVKFTEDRFDESGVVWSNLLKRNIYIRPKKLV